MRDKFGVTMGRVRLDGIPTGAADWPSDLKNSGMLSVGSRSTAAGLSCSSIRRQVTLSRITPSTRSGWGESSGRVGVAKGSSIAAVLITSAHATSGPGCRAARRSPKAPYVQRVPVDHSPDRQKRFQLREREHRGSRTVE